MTSTPSDRQARRYGLALILIYALFGALLNSVGSVNLLAVQSLGVSKAEASLLDAFKDLPIAVVSFLVASALPRVGLRLSLLLACAVVSGACLLMPVVAGFWYVKAFYATVGAAFAFVKVATYTSIGLLTRSPQEHGRLTALIEGVFMLGVLSSFWTFSAFADNADSHSIAWLQGFALYGVLLLAAAAAMLGGRVEERAAAHDPAASGSAWAAFVHMLGLVRSRLVAVFVLSAFLYVLIEQGISTWLPSFNRDVLQLPLSMSVALAIIMPAATALGRLLSAVLIGRFGWFRVVLCCVLAIGLTVAGVIPLASAVETPPQSWWHAPLVAYCIPLIGLFLAPIYPAVNSAVLSALPQRMHAPMTGLIVVFSALGGSTGSFVTGRLFLWFDGRLAFLAILFPLTLLLASLVFFHRLLSRQAASHE